MLHTCIWFNHHTELWIQANCNFSKLSWFGSHPGILGRLHPSLLSCSKLNSSRVECDQNFHKREREGLELFVKKGIRSSKSFQPHSRNATALPQLLYRADLHISLRSVSMHVFLLVKKRWGHDSSCFLKCSLIQWVTSTQRNLFKSRSNVCWFSAQAIIDVDIPTFACCASFDRAASASSSASSSPEVPSGLLGKAG